MTLSSEILADSPLLYWPLSETGATFVDASGNGRDGSRVGTITQGIDSGLFGNCVLTNGNSGYISGPNLGSLIATGFTQEILVKISSFPADQATLFTDNGLAYLWISSSGYIFGYDFRTSGNGFRPNSSVALALNNWYHVVASFNTSVGNFYINGVLVGTFTPAGSGNWADANPGSGLFIGSEGGAGRPLSAYVGHAAIYPTKLTEARILAHYNALINKSFVGWGIPVAS